MATAEAPRKRQRGEIEKLPSGSLRVRVYAGIDPITIDATYGAGFHHPHLRGATVGTWPLNVFDDGQARAELPVLRAIAAADLHNLVFQRDFRIVPVTTRGS